MTTSEWTLNDPNTHYHCANCKAGSGRIMQRYVTEDNSGTHKEYMVECIICHKKGTVHWSKRLAEFSWNGDN